MKKKFIILSILIFLLIAGGVFWWSQGREKIKSSSGPLGYIIIKETSEGKFVENKKEGLAFKVPNEWKVQLPTTEGESITMFNPSIVEGKVVWDIVSSVSYKTTAVPALKKERSSELSDLNGEQFLQFVSFETTTVAGRDALKTVIDTTTPEGGGEHIVSVDIPTSDKVYSFTTHAGLQDKEKSKQEFNRFLESVLFK